VRASLKRFNYAVARRFVRLLARPTVNATVLDGREEASLDIVYALIDPRVKVGGNQGGQA